MPQATFKQDGRHVDYTPGSAVTAGDVIVQGNRLLGIANADIAAGRKGALATKGVFTFTKSTGASTAFAAGDRVYWDDAANLAAQSGETYLGTCVLAAGDNDTKVRVKLGHRGSEAPALKFANTAVSAEVENTTTETAFDKFYDVPAGTVKAGDVFHIRAAVNVLDNNSTDTLTLRLKIGGVTIVATAAVDVQDNDVGYFDAWVSVVSVSGGTGFVAASGVQVLGVPGTTVPRAFFKGSALVLNLISSGARIEVTAQWSGAHADNECRLEYLAVEKLQR